MIRLPFRRIATTSPAATSSSSLNQFLRASDAVTDFIRTMYNSIRTRSTGLGAARFALRSVRLDGRVGFREPVRVFSAETGVAKVAATATPRAHTRSARAIVLPSPDLRRG